MRRSVAHKLIKHFITLGVDPFIITDVMLYNIEIAQTYSSENAIKQELFYKSMFNSFEQAVDFIISNGIYADFKTRIGSIFQETVDQKWINQYEFERIISRVEF
jgi:C4-dicarboxylate transporter